MLLEKGYEMRVYDCLEPQVHGGLQESGRWPTYLNRKAKPILGDVRPRQAMSSPYTGIAATFSWRLLNGQPPIVFEDGLQTRDLVHVSDTVQANLLAMRVKTTDYAAVSVGTGCATSGLQVAEMLARALGKSIEARVVGKFQVGDISEEAPAARKLTDLLDAKEARCSNVGK
jgi:nucleoside-diphosphate-sugar epimerase